jgi:hypothetical protein
MELLAARGPEQIDDWSVSLEQDAIGTPETVKETLSLCVRMKI